MGGTERAIRADIQGLRAIAVLSVVAYHANESLLPGGFVGVDIFFVISGFLITSILLRELEQERMSIAGFYERRIKRLFPALFAMLAAVLLAGAFLMAPSDFAELGRTALSTVFFLSNFQFYLLSGYFDGAAADKPLLHTWSLAVEEQFYILYPLLLALVWKSLRKQLLLLLILGAALAFGLSVWGALYHHTAAFYLTPFRAFELAIGAVIAVAGFQFNQLVRNVLSLTGLLMIAASFAFINDATPFPGFAALGPCLGTAFVIAAGVGGRSIGGALISFPAFTFFGAISYSLYLWHWPALSLGRHAVMGELNAPQTAVLLAGALIAATLSWKFLEQPVLRGGFSRRSVFAAGGAAMLGAAAISGAIVLSSGWSERFSPETLQLFAAVEDHNQRRAECHSNEDAPIGYDENCVFGAEGAEPIAAVWGDSAGAELVVALGEALRARGQSVAEITSSACAPAIDYHLPERQTCTAHNRETLARLQNDERIRVVILSINFQRYPAPERRILYGEVEAVVDQLLAAGKTIVLEYPAPNPFQEAPRVLGLMHSRGMPLDSVGLPYDIYLAENAPGIAFYDRLLQRERVYAFRPAEAVCSQGFCPLYRADVGVLYFNGNHLSITGARFALSRFPFEALPPER
jgi:peptidoglycan/LPS O-acetylase OafA/YrhL